MRTSKNMSSISHCVCVMCICRITFTSSYHATYHARRAEHDTQTQHASCIYRTLSSLPHARICTLICRAVCVPLCCDVSVAALVLACRCDVLCCAVLCCCPRAAHLHILECGCSSWTRCMEWMCVCVCVCFVCVTGRTVAWHTAARIWTHVSIYVRVYGSASHRKTHVQGQASPERITTVLHRAHNAHSHTHTAAAQHETSHSTGGARNRRTAEHTDMSTEHAAKSVTTSRFCQRLLNMD